MKKLPYIACQWNSEFREHLNDLIQDTDKSIMTAQEEKKPGRRPRSLRTKSKKKRIYQLVVNNSSGFGAEEFVAPAERLTGQLKRAGYDCYLRIADSYDDFAEKVSNAVRRRPFATVVFGGDGTVRVAAARVVKAKGLLGIIPCGRQNNIFRSLYGHADIDKALEIVQSEYQTRIDAGLANGHFFVGSLIGGMIPELIHKLGNKKMPRLAMTWNKLAGSAVDDTPVKSLKLTVDSFNFEADPHVIHVHLLPYVMALPFAPAAISDDGCLVALYDRGVSREDLIHYVRDLRRDKYQYTNGIVMVRGKRLILSPAAARNWMLDGDEIDFPSGELAVEVMHRVLRVFANAPVEK